MLGGSCQVLGGLWAVLTLGKCLIFVSKWVFFGDCAFFSVFILEIIQSLTNDKLLVLYKTGTQSISRDRTERWEGSCSPWHPSLAPVSPHWPNWCCPGAPAAHKLLPSESEGCDELVVPVLAHEEGESRVEKRWEKRENQHENES